MKFRAACSILIIFISPIIKSQTIISSDITNFWRAYDACVQTRDTAEQKAVVQHEFIDKASEGQRLVMELKNYTVEEYVYAINNYRGFWQTIRENYKKLPEITASIQQDLQKLAQYYKTDLSNPIYLTVGLFRTGGTAYNKSVIIGTEVSFMDSSTNISELPAALDYIKKHAATNPIQHIPLLCTHEYIHSLQKPIVHNLLSYCIYEGTAEYLSCFVTGKSSTTPAVYFGKQNHTRIIAQFEKELFIPAKVGNWLWSSQPNLFGIRDLGYYVGYAFCDSLIQKANNKTESISHLINLDLSNEAEVESLVNSTDILSMPLSTLYENFEKSRPFVASIVPAPNSSIEVSDSDATITITFSQPMDITQRGFDYGPLGEEHVLSVKEVVGFSADAKSFTFKAAVKPGKSYQVLFTNRFCSASGVPLKPFIYEITTK